MPEAAQRKLNFALEENDRKTVILYRRRISCTHTKKLCGFCSFSVSLLLLSYMRLGNNVLNLFPIVNEKRIQKTI